MSRQRKSLYPDLSGELNGSKNSYSSYGNRSNEDDNLTDDSSASLRRSYSSRRVEHSNRTRTTDQSSSSIFDDSRSFSQIFSNFCTEGLNELESLKNDPVDFVERWIEYLSESRTGKIIAISLAVVLIILLSWLFVHPSKQNKNISNQQRNEDLMRSIELLLNNNNDKLHRSLKYAVRVLSQVEPEATTKPPVIFLFAGAQLKANMLIRNVSLAIRQNSNVFVWEQDLNSATSRIELETTVFTALASEVSKQRRLLVLYNIDQLDNSAPLVLHSLADAESSPFKGIVIIATISLSDDSTIRCSERVSKHLLSAWKSADLSDDQVHPIISRMNGISVCLD
ncbi:hypothetical protein M3Y98_01112900 [Aphelenchoides besseyi]|nr:hypothetical protein M3Y98_01112900 [Aphelenchoides besseyi]KAI6209200.1 hypothetical protein M3Y96_00196200 [Aphelenchoides besseyi]